eukprot:COSAG01_NODE_2397_length_7771_cov_12.578076_3_plen_121_part_00
MLAAKSCVPEQYQPLLKLPQTCGQLETMLHIAQTLDTTGQGDNVAKQCFPDLLTCFETGDQYLVHQHILPEGPLDSAGNYPQDKINAQVLYNFGLVFLYLAIVIAIAFIQLRRNIVRSVL